MAVYVDDAIYPFRGMLMCHMLADTPLELHQMAEAIGVQRKWVQVKNNPGATPHFDIAKGKRAKAVQLGAVELKSRQEIVAVMDSIRDQCTHERGICRECREKWKNQGDFDTF